MHIKLAVLRQNKKVLNANSNPGRMYRQTDNQTAVGVETMSGLKMCNASTESAIKTKLITLHANTIKI